MKGLEKFESTNHKMKCSICGKTIQRYSKINIRATDPIARYNGSSRPIIHTYRFDLCEDHFNKFKKVLNDFIESNSEEDVLDLYDDLES